MFITRVTCDASRPGMDIPPCPYLDVVADGPEGLPAAFHATLAEAAWIEDAGLHYCPRHNPDLAGMPVVLSDKYIEPLPGVRIRATGAYGGERIKAEILFDKARYDVDNPGAGAIWRAKHVSEDWPT